MKISKPSALGMEGGAEIARPRLSLSAAALAPFALGEIVRQLARGNVIDLALGIPPIDAPEPVKAAAVRAILQGENQYGNTWGIAPLRQAIAAHAGKKRRTTFEPETEVTVTIGTTEALYAALSILLDQGDEVILFEPFYEQHLHAIRALGGVPRRVRLHDADWHIDEAELAAAFSARTRVVVLNTPHNPTGKVWTVAELERLGALCSAHDVVVVSDEIYDEFVFDGREHVSPMQVESLRPRTVLIAGLSKTFRVSGWRLGYILAAPQLSEPLRRLHDLMTAGTVTPLQHAGLAAFSLPAVYYSDLCAFYQRQRDRTVGLLERAGLRCRPVAGSIYIMADVSGLGLGNDRQVVDYFMHKLGIALAPGSCFFADPEQGRDLVRICFAKIDATLDAAEARLRPLFAKGSER